MAAAGAYGAVLLLALAPPGEGARYRHHLAVLEEPLGEGGTTRVVEAPFAFDELVPSWNVEVDGGAGFVCELAVRAADGGWSPWLLVGTWRLPPAALVALAAEREARTRAAAGRVDVDTFVAAAPVDAARLRFTAVPAGTPLRVRRAALCFSVRAEPGGEAGRRRAGRAGPVAVPFRSQRELGPALAPRACCPTSLAMVLAALGDARPTAEVARLCHDPLYDLYGSWPRAIQAAFALGHPGRVERFGSWDEVARRLDEGLPIVASVLVAGDELAGAPITRGPEAAGHLLVVRGLDGEQVLVCDPAHPDAAGGVTRYPRAELVRAWLERRRGTALVIEPAVGAPAPPPAPDPEATRGG